MPDVKISELPAGSANANAVVPATNAAGTTTQKVTMGAIAALGGGPPAAHKSTHQTGGADALAAADIGAAAASHAHGNVTNAGAIGTTANLPLITGASGVLQAGSFGSSANTFCQGNDSRLSDARTPTAHKSTHATGGSDALTAADIGAAATSHAHSGSDITSGTVAAARLGTHASTHQTGGTDQIDPVIVTPASLSSSQNNYAPGVCDILRLSSSTAIDITGLAAATADGALRLIINTNASGGAAITLKHESASSTAANRFRSVTTADVVLLADGGSVTLTYSNAISRWRIL